MSRHAWSFVPPRLFDPIAALVSRGESHLVAAHVVTGSAHGLPHLARTVDGEVGSVDLAEGFAKVGAALRSCRQRSRFGGAVGARSNCENFEMGSTPNSDLSWSMQSTITPSGGELRREECRGALQNRIGSAPQAFTLSVPDPSWLATRYTVPPRCRNHIEVSALGELPLSSPQVSNASTVRFLVGFSFPWLHTFLQSSEPPTFPIRFFFWLDHCL